MALLMRQAHGLLSGLGDTQESLHGALIAAKQSGLPESVYQNLWRASDLLVTSEDYLPKQPDAARAWFVNAQRLFKAEEQVCIDSNPAYCTKIGTETFASIFRKESTRILDRINSPGPAQQAPRVAPGEWGWENYVLLGLGALGAYVMLRGLFKGARAIGAGAAAGARAAREVVRS